MAIAKKQTAKEAGKKIAHTHSSADITAVANTNSPMKNDNAIVKKYEDTHFVDSTKPVWNYSLLTEEVIRNYQNGNLYNAYEYFGSHALEVLNTKGYYFAVWAPNATKVSVVGNFNDWKKNKFPLFIKINYTRKLCLKIILLSWNALAASALLIKAIKIKREEDSDAAGEEDITPEQDTEDSDAEY